MNFIKEFFFQLLNSISSIFKRSTEDRIQQDNNTVEQGVELAQAEVEIDRIKEVAKKQEKLNRKMDNRKKGFPVTKMKEGKTVRVMIEGKWEKALFESFDEQGVNTSIGKFPYGNVVNYHMKLLFIPPGHVFHDLKRKDLDIPQIK